MIRALSIPAAGIAAISAALSVAIPGKSLADNARPATNFVAAGAAAVPDYPGAERYQPAPFVAGRFQYADQFVLSAAGTGLELDLLGPRSRGRWIAGPTLRFDPGREDVDNTAVAALDEVDPTIEGGAFAGVRWTGLLAADDALTLKVTGLGDLGDGHDGFRVTPSVDYARNVADAVRLGVSAGLVFADDAYQSAFFDVAAEDSAVSGLSAFDADGGINAVDFGLRLSYRIAPEWGLLGRIGYTRLLGDAADSPVVETAGSPDQLFAGLALAYWF